MRTACKQFWKGAVVVRVFFNEEISHRNSCLLMALVSGWLRSGAYFGSVRPAVLRYPVCRFRRYGGSFVV